MYSCKGKARSQRDSRPQGKTGREWPQKPGLGEMEAGWQEGGLITSRSAHQKANLGLIQREVAGTEAPGRTQSPAELQRPQPRGSRVPALPWGWRKAGAILGRQLCGQGAEKAPLFSCHLRRASSQRAAAGALQVLNQFFLFHFFLNRQNLQTSF